MLGILFILYFSVIVSTVEGYQVTWPRYPFVFEIKVYFVTKLLGPEKVQISLVVREGEDE